MTSVSDQGDVFVAKWDLRDSRSIEDRDSFEGSLDALLRTLTTRCGTAKAWARKPGRTAGIDEITAVAHDPAVLVKATFVLNLELWPAHFRVGLGRGGIDIDHRTLAKMDGSAFHRAREAVDAARAEHIMIAARSAPDHRPPTGTIEALSDAWAVLVDGWTDREHECVLRWRELGKQTRVAEELGLSPAAVSQALARAHAQTVNRLESAMVEWANRWKDAGHAERQ